MDFLQLAFLNLNWPQIAGFLTILFGLGVVIFVHELGHFLAARWAGIKVEVFSLGFGPRLIGFKRGDTDYRLSLIPLGGYVSMLGQEDVGEVKEIKDPDAFCNRPVGKRAVVLSAGVVMNVLFSLVAFMVLFLMGKEYIVAQVGRVQTGSPAAKAGLLPGDRIVRVNGHEVTSFQDLKLEVIFSGGDVSVDVDRNGDGVSDKTLKVTPEKDPINGMRQLGIAPDDANDIAGIVMPMIVAEVNKSDDSAEPVLRKNDVILTANRDMAYEMETLDRLAEQNATLRLVILRDGKTQTVEVTAPPEKNGKRDWGFELVTLEGTDQQKTEQGMNILDALEALPRADDKIIRIAGKSLENGFSEILHDKDIRGRYGEVVSATVLRDGTEREVFVVLTIPVNVGTVALGLCPAVRIKSVEEGRTAQKEGLQADDVILRIGNQDWPALWQMHRELAASRDQKLVIEIERDGEKHPKAVEPRLDPKHGTVRIGIVTMLPEGVRVSHVMKGSAAEDGKIEPGWLIKTANGAPVPDWHAFMRAVVDHAKTKPGQKIALTVENDKNEILQRELDVRIAEMPDVALSGVYFKRLMGVKQTHNPLEAVWLGCQETITWIKQVYLFLAGMASGNVGAGGAAGPVRIIGQGAQIAEHGGFSALIWFLGLLSANLAVVNFLPFPILDGGHMVFLMYEKLRGKPAPAKLQMTLNLIGLALILFVFVSLTINDIRNMFTG